MAALGSLVVTLGLDAAEFMSGLSKSEYESKKTSERIQRTINQAGQLATTALTSMGLAGVAAFAKINAEADKIAGLQDVAEKIGDTAEQVSSLQLALDLSGTSVETFTAASVRLTANLSKTDDEAKGAGRALAAIGLSLDDFKRRNPVEQIDMIARKLADFEDGASKTAVAVALFGKAGAELLPFLNDLAEEQERNIRLTTDQIKAADEYTKAQARLRSEFDLFIQRSSADAIPVLAEVQRLFTQIAKDQTTVEVVTGILNASMRTAITVFQAVAVVGTEVGFVFLGVGREIGAIVAQLAALARFDIAGFRAISEAVKTDGERARAELDKFQARIMSLGVTGTPIDDEARRRLGRGADAPRKRSIDFDASEAKKKISDLEKFEREVAERVRKDRIAALLAEYDEREKAAQAQADREIDLAKRVADEARRNTEEARRLAESVETPFERMQRKLEEIATLAENNPLISAETTARLNTEAWKEYIDSLDAAAKKVGELDDFTKRAAENIQDQLGNGLYDILTGNFQNIGKSFSNMIARMVAEAQAAKIARELFGESVSGGSGKGLLGDVLGAVVGFMFGGSGGGAGMPDDVPTRGGRAIGGPVDAGGMYEVAERGPEMLDVNGRKFLLMGNQRGNIEARPSFGGGGDTYVFNGGVSRSEVIAGMNRARVQAVTDVYEARRRGAAMA